MKKKENNTSYLLLSLFPVKAFFLLLLFLDLAQSMLLFLLKYFPLSTTKIVLIYKTSTIICSYHNKLHGG